MNMKMNHATACRPHACPTPAERLLHAAPTDFDFEGEGIFDAMSDSFLRDVIDRIVDARVRTHAAWLDRTASLARRNADSALLRDECRRIWDRVDGSI